MDCEQAKTTLVAYLLEEISPPERAEVGRHLGTCESCAEELVRLKQTLALVAQGETSEEIPQHIRLVAEPVGPWAAFWRNSARLAFAGGGLLCLAIAFLSLFRTTVSYRGGNWELAFGVAPAAAVGEQTSPGVPAAVVSSGLDRTEISRLIAVAVAAGEAKQRESAARLLQTVAQQSQQQRVRDLQDMAESIRYFQAAQTMMWKEQMQSQQLVGALVRQVGSPSGQP